LPRAVDVVGLTRPVTPPFDIDTHYRWYAPREY